MIPFFLFLLHPLAISAEPTDPLYPYDFPLQNRGKNFGILDEDIHFSSVFERHFYGNDISVNVISNGCVNHEDFGEGLEITHSHNYYTNGTNPAPFDMSNESLPDGTYLAGVIAARTNEICSVGVAPLTSFTCFALYGGDAYNRMNFLDALKRNNDRNRVKLIGKPLNSDDPIQCFPDDDQELSEILNTAPDNINFVVSAGNEADHGVDTNYFAIARNPRVIVVADSNNRGARSAWSNRGCNIFINAPAGGSSSFPDDKFPSPPGLSIDTDSNDTVYDKCSVSNDPTGTGAALVAGVIAIMLDIQPSLGWREVQALLATTSSRNDPDHFSWSNSGIISYSPFYGFGRVNLESIIGSLEKSSFTMPPQYNDTFEKSNINQKISGLRNGISTVSFSVNTSIIFTEYVELEINLTIIQSSLLRIFVESPSKNYVNVKSYSSEDDREIQTKTVKFLLRNFFYENPNGQWNIQMIYDSPADESALINSVILKVTGCNVQPSIPFIYGKQGSNPYQKPNDSQISSLVTLTPSKTELKCEENIEVNININSQEDDNSSSILFDLYLSDANRNSRWPIAHNLNIIANQDNKIPIKIPCLFKDSSEFILIAENTEYESYGETRIQVLHNTSTAGFGYIVSPIRYEKLDIENDIEVKISLTYDHWIDNEYNQRCRVSLYDIDKKQIIYQDEFSLLLKSFNANDNDNQVYTEIKFKAPQKCERCILSVVPSYDSNQVDGCLEIIQPVSVLNLIDSGVDPFALPLNDYCPIPPAVLTPTPKPDIPTPTEYIEGGQNPAALAVGISFLVVFFGLIVLFFWCNRASKDLGEAFNIKGEETFLI